MNNSTNNKNIKELIVAGGCFWCMEPPFDHLPGVIRVVSGYTGGKEKNPTYNEVASGQTGHREAVKIVYDATIIGFRELLEIFWRSIDPTDSEGQFADRGNQYKTAIFYETLEEKSIAEMTKNELVQSGRFNKPIKTEIIQASEFYPAEDYHQGYHKKNDNHYRSYRFLSGREPFLNKTWGNKEK